MNDGAGSKFEEGGAASGKVQSGGGAIPEESPLLPHPSSREDSSGIMTMNKDDLDSLYPNFGSFGNLKVGEGIIGNGG